MRKMIRLQTIQLKGENCKHRLEAKGDSSKHITTMIFLITLHGSLGVCPTMRWNRVKPVASWTVVW